MMSKQKKGDGTTGGHYPTAECGEVLETLSLQQLRKRLWELAGQASPGPGLRNTGGAFALRGLSTALETYGIRVQKICASCSTSRLVVDGKEYSKDEPYSELFQDYCGPDSYGYNSTFSGLLFLPVVPADENVTDVDVEGKVSVVSGSLKVAMWDRFLATSHYYTPTEWWIDHSAVETSVQMWSAALSASHGLATIMPDFMGHGTSHDLFENFLVKRAYQTSAVPLLLGAQEQVALETGCKTELANTVVLSGFSEGAYASVSVAEALADLGMDVVAQAGGGPFALSTYEIPYVLTSVDKHRLKPEHQHIIGLMAASYSRKNPEMPYYGQDVMDIMNPEFRQGDEKDLIDLINKKEGTTTEELFALVNSTGDPLDLLNQIGVNYTRVHNRDHGGPFNACDHPGLDPRGDHLCDALRENDLVSVIEAGTFQANLCQSPTDELASFAALPNITLPTIFLTKVQGGHVEAAGMCILNFVKYFLTPQFFLKRSKPGLCRVPPHGSLSQEGEKAVGEPDENSGVSSSMTSQNAPADVDDEANIMSVKSTAAPLVHVDIEDAAKWEPTKLPTEIQAIDEETHTMSVNSTTEPFVDVELAEPAASGQMGSSTQIQTIPEPSTYLPNDVKSHLDNSEISASGNHSTNMIPPAVNNSATTLSSYGVNALRKNSTAPSSVIVNDSARRMPNTVPVFAFIGVLVAAFFVRRVRRTSTEHGWVPVPLGEEQIL